MKHDNPTEHYMREIQQERKRINRSFDTATLSTLVKKSFESKHAEILAAKATRFTTANVRTGSHGFEVNIRVDSPPDGRYNYAHNDLRHEFSYPILKWKITSPFESLVARAWAKLSGLDILAEKIADQAMADIAKHEAILVMRGILPAPSGWDALGEKLALGDSTPEATAQSTRRPGL